MGLFKQMSFDQKYVKAVKASHKAGHISAVQQQWLFDLLILGNGAVESSRRTFEMGIVRSAEVAVMGAFVMIAEAAESGGEAEKAQACQAAAVACGILNGLSALESAIVVDTLLEYHAASRKKIYELLGMRA